MLHFPGVPLGMSSHTCMHSLTATLRAFNVVNAPRLAELTSAFSNVFLWLQVDGGDNSTQGGEE